MRSSPSHANRRGPALLGLLLLTQFACTESVTNPADNRGESIIGISADVSATTAGLTVEITATDIDPAIVQNIPIVANVASGTVRIPAGSRRTITVRAFDEGAVETHRGTEILDIQPDVTVQVTMTLDPLFGDVPLTVNITNVIVTVTPSAATILLFETVQLTATVTDATGVPIPGASVDWAAFNPVIASVDASGLVTGSFAGTTNVVASFGRVTAAANITVEGAEKISFNRVLGGSNVEIFVTNPDGSGLFNLTNRPSRELSSAWSPDGRRIAYGVGRDGAAGLYVADPDGSNEIKILDTQLNRPEGIAWSPDGQRLTYHRLRDIWVVNADGTGLVNLTNVVGTERNSRPNWSPDSQKIVFDSNRDGDADIYVMNADGTQVTQLTNGPGSEIGAAWSPDGQTIAFTLSAVSGNVVFLHTMNADGTGITQITPFPAVDPAWSPDGTRIAFGNFGNIAVVNADGTNPALVTNDALFDFEPSWAVVVGAPN